MAGGVQLGSLPGCAGRVDRLRCCHPDLAQTLKEPREMRIDTWLKPSLINILEWKPWGDGQCVGRLSQRP